MPDCALSTNSVTLLRERPGLLTVTNTLPDTVPNGTGKTMLVSLQLVGVTEMPPTVTVLMPWVAPKLVPVIVTNVPAGPALGESPVMLGVTVKPTPLLDK